MGESKVDSNTESNAESNAESKEVYLTLDLALRVGEVLLSSGAGAADVTATMLSITHGLGLRSCVVDVTFTSLQLIYQPGPEEQTQSQMRQVKHRDIDYTDLTEVDHLVHELLLGEIDLTEARSRLAQVVSSGHEWPRWQVSIGWGVMGIGIALLLGGDWIVVLIAFVAAVGIDLLKRSMSRRRLPAFYQQVAGGLLATLLAVGTAATDLPVDPSLVVTSSIIMLLAGVAFMGAIQDALSGFYVTSGARLLEATLATAGIIAGVSGGLTVGQMLGVEIAIEPGLAGFSYLPVMAFGAGLAAAAFAFACYAPLRALLPILFVSALGEIVFFLMEVQGFGRAFAAAGAAVAIGAVSYTVAGRFRVPPLAVVVPAIIPLLPGLSIYRGLSLIAEGDTFGILAMATAVGIAIALSSGVILGEYVAQPLKREARRLEHRLSGPRLVGPLRARSVKREGKRETAGEKVTSAS